MSRTPSEVAKSNVSRSKSHERRVAKLLSDWSGVDFRRRRVTGRDHATRMVEMTADVIPVGADFKFSIEAKCGAGFSLDALLANPDKALFTTWWHQTCYDAKIATDHFAVPIYPMLFFKPIPSQDWVAVSSRAFLDGGGVKFRTKLQHLSYEGYSTFGEISCNVSHTKNKKFVPLQLDDVVMCRWRDFEVAVDPPSTFR